MRAGHRGSGEPPRRRLLLAGGGHSHALLLRRWAMRPERRPAATAITLVSRHGSTLYSGLLPALVAGHRRAQACSIDLRRLCLQAGVTFMQAEIAGLDTTRRQLLLAERPALTYDLLSLDVGAITAAPADGPEGTAAPMAVKPLEPFLAWCAALPPGQPVRIRGGGAAAVELALALKARGHTCELLLRETCLQLGSDAANRAGERLLTRAGIALRRRTPGTAPADLLCTGSRAPHWLAASGLPVDLASGRVLTGADLRVLDHGDLFASGDCGLVAAAPRPPSGVWAVRSAPLLAQNIERRLRDAQAPLRLWHPQRRALQLLADGSQVVLCAGEAVPQALALWGPWAIGPSPWLGRWKDWIDRRFLVALHGEADAPRWQGGGSRGGGSRGDGTQGERAEGSGGETSLTAPGSGASGPGRDGDMACRGCAAKLAAAPLAAALARLGAGGQATAVEDAVPLARRADGSLLLQSLDGFPALVEDPWLNARLTTLHACSDLWACGARVESVQALVTVPLAAADLQQELLYQSLAGVRSVLDPLAARLLGGHTLEGRDGAGLSLALTVQGPVVSGTPWSKGPLPPGSVLLLSRPLGSGVLLAAAMAGAAEAGWIDGLLRDLQQCQAPLVELLAAHDCRACTDITGFGLLGHLGEMLSGGRADGPPAALRVSLDAGAIPAWPGALELLARGFASSLAPANAAALALLEGPVRLQAGGDAGLAATAETGLSAARRALLIDPQTCGPLLAALPAEQAPAALQALRAAGFGQARLIGRVEER